MKTTLSQLMCIFMLSIFPSVAQTDSNLNELLSRLNQNHSGAITDVFSSEEIDQLNHHFSNQRADLNVQPRAVLSGDVFAPENVNGNFGSFATNNPEVYDIITASGVADFEGAGAYHSDSGFFYVIDNSGNSYAVNPETGENFPNGMVMAPPGESFTGLEFDPNDGTLYAISTNGMGTSTLSIIDANTGEVTVIGDTGLILAIALAIDTIGQFLYAFDIDTDAAYRINKSTAEAFLLGPLGFDASFGQGMFLNALTGQICLTAFNNTEFRSELRMLNTKTGATTLVGPIGSTSPGGTLQFAWSGQNKTNLDVTETTISAITVLPNPATRLLEVSASVNIEEIVLVTMLGQELLRTHPDEKNTILDIDFLAAGSYILYLRSDGRVTSHKFIKE